MVPNFLLWGQPTGAPAGGNGKHVELLFPSVMLAGEVTRAGWNATEPERWTKRKHGIMNLYENMMGRWGGDGDMMGIVKMDLAIAELKTQRLHGDITWRHERRMVRIGGNQNGMTQLYQLWSTVQEFISVLLEIIDPPKIDGAMQWPALGVWGPSYWLFN